MSQKKKRKKKKEKDEARQRESGRKIFDGCVVCARVCVYSEAQRRKSFVLTLSVRFVFT